MKTFEQIAQAMYDDYRANHIHNLAEWHQITQMNRDCWIEAAKAKALHQEILAGAPMEQNQQPEALDLASFFENWFIAFAESDRGSRARAAKEPRRLHARVQELEAMLDAVGAGGVSAQRVTQAADHIAQDRKMVAAQEPFGYFKAEPFGWRDCAETEEGAIALYEAPQPQADARDAARWSEIGKSIERACGELPEDFEINIHLENGAGTVVLLYPNGEECENFPHDDGFAGVVNAAIDAAIAAEKEMK